MATTYFNGPGIDNHLRQTNSTTGVSYFLADHLGSTAALTDAAGSVVEQETYDSFGNSSGSSRTRYAYTGRERDPDTGMLYYRARFYDPQVGRFLNEDPIGLVGGFNLYEYAYDNPLRFVDPTGTQWQQALAGGGTLTGVASTGALGAFAAAAAPVAAVVVVGGAAIYGAWQLGEAIAEAPWNPFTHPRDLPAYPRAVPKCDSPPKVTPIPPPPPPPGPKNGRERRCDRQYYEVDVPTCNGITRSRGAWAGQRCHASAAQRYAACLAGLPLPPLDTWNN